MQLNDDNGSRESRKTTIKTSCSPSTLLFLICLCSGQSEAQTAFQNLNFESGTLVPIPNDSYQRVSADLAFPHWTVYAGTNRVDTVLYDNAFISSSGISIVDS